MIPIRTSVTAALFMSALASPVLAQPANRSVEAALEDLRDGYADTEAFFFAGCPQDDPLGRTIFEAVRDVPLDGEGRVSLARRFANSVYPHCEYQPLHAWLVALFEELRATGQDGAAHSFAQVFERATREEGFTVDDRLRAALLRAAEDDVTFLEGTRGLFVIVAFKNRPASAMVEEAVAALSMRIPRQTKASLTYKMSREHGAAFYQAAARAARRMTDDDLFLLVVSIRSEINDGRADPRARGLEPLRAEIARRPELVRSYVDIPRERRPQR
jgi:hypothetical protein